MRIRFWTYLGRLTFSLLFAFIFTKGYEGKTVVEEGTRYGFWIGLLIYVPLLFANILSLHFSGGALVARCIASVIEMVICGIFVAMLYKKEIKSTAA